MVRALAHLALPLALCGCGLNWYEAPGALLGANLAAVPVIQRDLFDAGYSAITGRDCSVVRLDRGQGYCRPLEPLPQAPPYCTATLGIANCWAVRAVQGPIPPGAPPLYDPPPGFAPPQGDGPVALSPAQNADRTRAWPPL